MLIPARSALEIGRLRNERYSHAGQTFVNGRKFNLLRISSGSTIITPDNFDAHFRRNEYGVAWVLR